MKSFLSNDEALFDFKVIDKSVKLINMVVVQLAERCIWDAEVAGSSPAYHTK